jgi:AraC-like DNA-binding protein
MSGRQVPGILIAIAEAESATGGSTLTFPDAHPSANSGKAAIAKSFDIAFMRFPRLDWIAGNGKPARAARCGIPARICGKSSQAAEQQQFPHTPMPAEKPHVAAIAVVDLARELKRHAVVSLAQIQAIDRRLAQYALSLEKGRDVSALIEARYPESWMLALWRLAESAAPASGIGARIGATVSPQARGLLANLMLHCDDLGEVLDTYLANIGLTNASETWRVERQGGRVALVFEFRRGKPYPRCAVERSVVALYCWARYLCGRDLPLDSVEFAYPEPAYAAYLRSLLPCEVRFGAGRHAILFAGELLSWPLPRRDRYVKGLLREQIAGLNLAPGARSTGERVRALLRKDLAAHRAVEPTARALFMSRATLHRRLKDEGTAFSIILDEERRRLLGRHRRDPVARLCELLGYREPSAYYKARKRWGLGAR